MKNKIFVITFIFIMLLCSTCFATDYENSAIENFDFYTLNVNKLNFVRTCLSVAEEITPDVDYKYYLLTYNSSNNTYYFLASDTDIYDFRFNEKGWVWTIGNMFLIEKSASSYIVRHDNINSNYCNYSLGSELLYSNFDMYSDKNFTGDLVFQQPPLMMLEAVEETMIMKTPTIMMEMKEALGTLVPIAILVLSMLLLIYLIRLVILRVG